MLAEHRVATELLRLNTERLKVDVDDEVRGKLVSTG
jgi:hypothetical protein